MLMRAGGTFGVAEAPEEVQLAPLMVAVVGTEVAVTQHPTVAVAIQPTDRTEPHTDPTAGVVADLESSGASSAAHTDTWPPNELGIEPDARPTVGEADMLATRRTEAAQPVVIVPTGVPAMEVALAMGVLVRSAATVALDRTAAALATAASDQLVMAADQLVTATSVVAITVHQMRPRRRLPHWYPIWILATMQST